MESDTPQTNTDISTRDGRPVEAENGQDHNEREIENDHEDDSFAIQADKDKDNNSTTIERIK